MKSTQRIPKSCTVSYYCIAFLDIQGQKDDILSFCDVPSTREEEEKVTHVLRDTVGTVVFLREKFLGYFEALERDTGLLDSLAPEQRAEAEKLRRCQAEVRGVSDSIIITIPLYYSDAFYTPMKSIYSSLYAICAIFILALVRGKPFRGGVDIGWGVRLPDAYEEVYGSALVKAYNLENTRAEYPRVLVGDTLLKYMNDVETISPDSRRDMLEKEYATECKKLISVDYDYLNILDIIGEGAQSIRGGIDSKLVEKGYKSIVDTHKRLTIAGDTKLGSRYGSLRSYLESRLHLWNIQPCV